MIGRYVCWMAVALAGTSVWAGEPAATAEPSPAASYESVSTGNRAIDLLIDSPPLAASAPVPAASMPERDRRAKAASGKASGAGADDPEAENLRDALLRDAAALAIAEQKRVRTAAEQAIAEAEPETLQAVADGRSAADGARGRDEAAAGGLLARLTSVIGLLREYRRWLLAVALAAVGLAVAISFSRGTHGHGRRHRLAGQVPTTDDALIPARRPRGKR